jgi:hypothetical protein
MNGIQVSVKDVRASEAAVVAVEDGQGELGISFAPLFPAVEKDAKIVGVMEMSRLEVVIMAKDEIKGANDLTGVKLGSHSPKGSMQAFVVRDVVGADRLLFGSDFPFGPGDPHAVANVRKAGLGDADEKAALGDNAVRVFRLED